MSNIKSVLAITDFSVHAGNAVARAALVAAQHGARVRVLHVVLPSWFHRAAHYFATTAATGADAEAMIPRAHKALVELTRHIIAPHDVQVSIRVEVGRFIDVVRRESDNADLIVLGDTSVRLMRHLFLGSTPLRLLQKCRLPLLVVKQPVREPYRHVLVQVGLLGSFEVAVGGALRFAPGADVGLLRAPSHRLEDEMRLASVAQPSTGQHCTNVLDQAGSRTVAVATKFEVQGSPLQVSLDFSTAKDMLLRDEAEAEADLVVLRAPSGGRLTGFLARSVTDNLLSSTKCDVLVTAQI